MTRLAAGELAVSLIRAAHPSGHDINCAAVQGVDTCDCPLGNGQWITPDPPQALNSLVDPAARTVEIRYPPARGGLPILRSAREVGEYLCAALADVLQDPREHVYVLAMTTKGRLIVPPYLLGIGTENANLLSPKEVMRFALLVGARAIILAHTHPSGSTEPSPTDRQVSADVVAVGKLLDVHVADHVILAGCHRTSEDRPYFSMREAGML